MRQRRQRPGRRGFTLVEVMASLVLLGVVVFALGSVYSRSRSWTAYHEETRRATAAAQGQLDRLRTDLTFMGLAALDDSTWTVAEDGRQYTVECQVRYDGVLALAELDLRLHWLRQVRGQAVPDTVRVSTILSRSMAWPE